MYKFNDDEVRMLGVSAPVLLRMLKNREASIWQKVYGGFRNGTRDFTAEIAEFCSVRDQINEITNALKMRDAKGE